MRLGLTRGATITVALLASALATGAANADAAKPASEPRIALDAAVAPGTMPPLDAYGDLPGIEQMALSPAGDRIALISRLAGVRRLLVIEIATKSVKFNGDVGEAKLRDLAWAGNDIVLLTTSATVSLGPYFTASKYELSGVLVAPLAGGKAHTVFDQSRTIGHTTRGHFGTRLVGGKWTGFYGGIALTESGGSTYMTSGRTTLYQVDLSGGGAHAVARAASEGHRRDWLVDADGKVAATFDMTDATGRWTIVNAAGKPIASGTDPTGGVGLMFLGRDGTSAVYMTEDDTAGETHWMEVPLAGGAATEILPHVAIERAYVDPASGRMIGYLERGNPPVPHFFDSARAQAMAKVYRAFPQLSVSLADWTPDFSKLLVHTSGTARGGIGDSGTWYVVDVAAKRANPVGYDRLAIEPEAVGPVSTVAYKAADGLEMDGILTLPPAIALKGRAAKNLPVVLLPHGGPTSQDDAMFDWWAQAFAGQGYAVFQPNFRGSTNRSDGFRRAGYGQWGRKMQTDISDGLDALVRQGIADPKRACIVGASYGGYAALAGVTLQHGIYRCAVAVAGVADLTMMYNGDLSESGGNRVVSRSMRETLGDPRTFAAVSPRRHAAEADAPILLIHGKDDTVVSFHQSEAMASALRGAGKPVEMVVLRQEDHWLSRAATRKQMLAAAVAFVKKNDPPD